jgi:hypothetical protein
MGFWGKLGKAFSIAGPIAASFIPGGALASTGAKVLKGALTAGGLAAGGIMAGKAVAKDLSSQDENSKLLQAQGTRMFGAGEPAYEQALGTYGKLASGDKGTLASFTGTEASDLNQRLSNQIQRAKSTQSRGGATSKVLAEAPGELERSALALRTGARGAALDRLGTLGLGGAQAGNQAVGVAGQLGLARRGQNIGIAKDIGEGVGTILDKTGVWGKLGQSMGNIFGGNKGGTTPGTEIPKAVDLPKLPDFSTGDYPGMDTGLGDPVNLDLFGEQNKNLGGNMFTGIGSTSMGPLERVFGK